MQHLHDKCSLNSSSFSPLLFINVSGELGFKSNNYEVVYPIKVTEDGDFISHYIPQHFKKKRNANSNNKIHYVLSNSDKSYLIELSPNFKLLSPGLVTETHRGDTIKKRQIEKYPQKQCFYRGKIKNLHNSHVALSTCSGLVCITKSCT